MQQYRVTEYLIGKNYLGVKSTVKSSSNEETHPHVSIAPLSSFPSITGIYVAFLGEVLNICFPKQLNSYCHVTDVSTFLIIQYSTIVD